jgi:hypothetical protein
MRKNTRFFSGKNDSGSTIIEVVVALFVLSTLGVGAWYAVGVSLRLAGRLRDGMLANVRLLRLDDRLRGLAGRVYLPYWAPDGIVRIGDGALSVPYLDGDSKKELNVTFREGILTVGDGGMATRYAGFQHVELSAATDDSNHQCGVTVLLDSRDGKAVRIVARFGATPLGSLSSR